MPFSEAIKLALQSIWANKLRSVLTLLGVVISISSVITVVSLAMGAKEFVTSKINSFGASVIRIGKGPQAIMSAEEFVEIEKRKDITSDDFRAVQDRCKLCLRVGAQRYATGRVVYGKNSVKDATVKGWTWNMPQLSNQSIAQGRVFTESEDQHSARIAVVGADIVNNLLGPGDSLGKEVRVDGEPYTVVGVAEPQGKMFGSSQDNWVAIPITRFQSTYGPYSSKRAGSLSIYVDAGGGGAVLDETTDELRAIMRARRHQAPGQPDAFNIDSSQTFRNMLGNILSSFGAVVVAIAAVSLVVGGIVIMNIMLVAVTERTREIGVRKALGARRRDLLLQFLIESSCLSLLGGVIGVVFGIAMAMGISMAVGFPFILVAWAMVAALVVATAVGLFFGIYPAHKAASLDPIEALRAEL